MAVWQAIILGLVQGLAEFLPVSSSGHLVLLQNIFGISGNVLLFDVVLHLGTLGALFIVLWKDVVDILRRLIRPLTLMLILATLPTVVMTLLLGDAIDHIFTGAFLGWGFLITAIVLWLSDRIRVRRPLCNMDDVKWYQALLVGLAQAAAVLPGVSRSGSTITGSLAAGLDRDKATRFSFLMGIPAILGSLVYQVKDIAEVGLAASMDGIGWPAAIIGMIVALAVGIVAIKWMMKLVQKAKLRYFAIYVAVLGILVLLDQYIFNFFF